MYTYILEVIDDTSCTVATIFVFSKGLELIINYILALGKGVNILRSGEVGRSGCSLEPSRHIIFPCVLL